METSEMVVQTKCKGEGDNKGDTNIKKDSENHGTEVEFIDATQTPDHDDQNSSDWDPPGSVCGPHSNCPCSVHSKHTISDSEDMPLTNPTDNVLCEEDENGVRLVSVDNTETQLNDTVTLGPPGRFRQNKGSNGDISNGTLSQNGENNEDDGQSLLHTPHVELLDQSHRVKLYAEDKGPHIYRMRENLVTAPIITKNLTEAYKFLPIFGIPKNIGDIQQFQNSKVREYVGCGLSDEEFTDIAQFCSPEHLRTGNELKMSANYPGHEPLPDHIAKSLKISELGENLCIVKKLKIRVEKDSRQVYMRKLKYRGVRTLPMPQNEDYKISFSPLEPGKDLVFRVRVYRPFYCHGKDRHYTRHSIFSNDIVLLGRQKLTVLRDRLVCPNDVGTRTDMSHNPDEQPATSAKHARHSIFSNDIVLLGRQKLTVLRDRLVCPNDVGTRTDMSHNLDEQPATSAKELFPSGFLFINNAFYVDTRAGCKDHSASIRQWAHERRLGDFPRHDMTQVSLEQLQVRLGHPEVYIHQGDCEHLFTFSEVRLLNASDPLQVSLYPFHTAISLLQTVYCTTCAEFGARWIVTGCSRVPFDPAYFCDTCFKLYLYKDGKKIGNFKAYSYRGNEINILKPTG